MMNNLITFPFFKYGSVRLLLSLLLCLILLPGCKHSDDTENQQLQNMLNTAVHRGLPGIALTVKGRDFDFEGVAGTANFDTAEKLTTDSRFNIGSVAKTFLATVVVQLDYEGILDLNTAITQWLPTEITDRIPQSEDILLRHLLNHTAAVFDYSNDSEDWFLEFIKDPSVQWTHQDILPYFLDKPLHFAPGTDYRYSNSNYILAALIVESVTGAPYYESIRNRIIEPLALNHTYNNIEAIGIAGLAHGYLLDNGQLDDTYPWLSHFSPANEGMQSRPQDLAIFIRELFASDTILNDEMRETMTTTPGVGTPPSNYALGIIVGDSTNNLGIVYGHGGKNPGYKTEMLYLPEIDVSIVLSTNGGFAGGQYDEIFYSTLEKVVKFVSRKIQQP